MSLKDVRNDLKICEDHLARVSRTFALNIRVLRGNDYRSMLLAYLLCRIADTIEDEPSLSASAKIGYLAAYEELFPLAPDWPERVEGFMKSLLFEGTGPDRDLLFDTPRILSQFSLLPGHNQSVISRRVREMARGMASFQVKASSGGLTMLESRDELERYCYYVAGTVGLMITDLFFGPASGDGRVSKETYEQLHSRSVAFGLGLQITNIAKDFSGDLDRGWCYVPRAFFEAEGIEGGSSNSPEKHSAVLNRLVDMALENLDEAIVYVQHIPRRYARYRLFCLWPLLMAVETLVLVRQNREELVRGTAFKIERNDVKRIIRNSTLAVYSNRCVRSLYDRARREAGLSQGN